MPAESSDGARLGALLADLLDVADTRAHRDFRCAVNNAIAVEIDFLTIACLQKPKLTTRIDSHDGANRLIFMPLGLTAHETRPVLQLSAGTLERVIDGEGQIGITFILFRCASNVDLTTVRQREPNAYLILAAGLVPLARPSHHDATGRQPAKTALQRCNVLVDGRLQFRCAVDVFKLDLGWRLHNRLRFLTIRSRWEALALSKINPCFPEIRSNSSDAETGMPAQFTNLLVAIDGSEGAWRALDVALAMTNAASGSLTVITVGVELTHREVAEFRRTEGEEADASEVFADRLLAEARRRVDRTIGKPARMLLRWGDPAEAIINTIAEEKFDAIVVGRRGRGQLAGLLLGSVSQKVVSLAPCIVVVVP